MSCALVIPARNAVQTLPSVIEAWRKATPPPETIVIIDDASTDGTAEVAESSGANVVRLPQNLGRGAVRAHGMQFDGAPFVCMCDAALVPPAHFLARALEWFAQPTVAAVFAHALQPDPQTVVERWRARHLFKTRPSSINRRALLATGLCLLRRVAVEEAGGFDARLRCGEDADLGHRLLKRWDVIADPELAAVNLSSESVHDLLARYARWNSPQGLAGRAWLRQMAYAVKVMAGEDLRAGDPLAAFLSCAAPFYQLRPA